MCRGDGGKGEDKICGINVVFHISNLQNSS